MKFSLWLYSGRADGARLLVAENVELPPELVVTMNQAMVRSLYRWMPVKVKP